MSWDDKSITVIFGDYHLVVPHTITIIFLIYVLLVVLAFYVYEKFLRSKWPQGCRWKRVRGDYRPPFTKWRCKACAVEAYSTDQKPPKECKKPLKVAL